ncbi:MAG: chemotaxis protein CheD [Spirochaetes bacterium]|nr:chemotaxis protein CheD [Spirochaetota bacterium]
METPELIHVGIEDMKAASGKTVLSTTLGSCIAICLYDPIAKSGGMAHIMLPSFEETTNTNAAPERYADSAIPLLLYWMLSNGCKKERIYAKIAGGAEMFKRSNNSMMPAIGKNNIEKVKDILKNMKIDIKGEDIGGDYRRTVYFDLDTGMVTVKTEKIPNVII